MRVAVPAPTADIAGHTVRAHRLKATGIGSSATPELPVRDQAHRALRIAKSAEQIVPRLVVWAVRADRNRYMSIHEPIDDSIRSVPTMESPAKTFALSRRSLIAGGLALSAAPLLPRLLQHHERGERGAASIRLPRTGHDEPHRAADRVPGRGYRQLD